MAQIPEQEFTLETLYEWFRVREELAKVKAREAVLRSAVARHYFPDPKEGTQRVDSGVGDGSKIKCEHKLNRSVDEAMLTNYQDTFEGEGINVDDLIRRKPELNKKSYNQLTEEQKRLFDNCLIIKPATPTITVEMPKAKT